MEIKNNKVVSLIYELRKDSEKGAVIEQVDVQNPMTFLFGTGNLLPKFEENLAGLKVGSAFEFGLRSEDAYGPVVENAVVQIPKNIFEVNGEIDQNILQIGNLVPMMDNEGRRLDGKILEIDDVVVTMDFNHPMAGQDLHFKGEITEVRDATEEELSHGHVHNHHDHDCDDCGHDHHHGDDHQCSCEH